MFFNRLSVLVMVVFMGVLALAGPAAAGSGPKPWKLSWWPSHWDNLDFKPYLNDPKIPNNAQWNDDQWQPSDWADARGGVQPVVDGLFAANILVDVDAEPGDNEVEVGHNFMRLSSNDKRRVIAFVDHAYGITAADPEAVISVDYEETDEPIGLYNQAGLQLQ